MGGDGPVTAGPQERVAQLEETAQRAFQAGDGSTLTEACRSILAIDANSLVALELTGISALQNGDPRRAETYLHRAAALQPGNSRIANSLGLALARQNRRDEAIDCYRRAIAAQPGNARAHANLGNALCQKGSLEEGLASYESALLIEPHMTDAQFNKANALRALGRPKDAAAAYRAALAMAPKALSVLINLGALLAESGELEEAATHLRRALAVEQTSIAAQTNLGMVLRLQGRPEEAVVLLQQVTAAHPKYIQAHLQLGRALALLERWSEARTAVEVVLAAQPGLAEAHVVLGEICKAEGRWLEASDAYLSAIKIDPDLTKKRYHKAIGLERLEAGDFETSAEVMLAPVRLLRGPKVVPPPDTLLETSWVKLVHDSEQLGHLRRHGILDPSFDAVIAEYQHLLAAVKPDSDNRLPAISARRYPRVVANATRLNHLAEAPALPGGALNEALDAAAVEAAYRSNGPGATYVDDLLKPEALERLRRFCNDSTVWWQLEHTCELGSILHNGFACPLLTQIAHDLRRAFPGLLGPHRFTSLWAYKYFATPNNALAHDRSSGLDVHADDGAVTVNFWIAPDAGNLDPDSGGVRLWNREAPPAYFATGTRDERLKIVNSLMDPDEAPSLVVPHRANRAAIFNSNTLHRSDSFRFEETYTNRKISITIMFGRRANAGS